jgi:formamidopyrimidine-DNA glycosylase
MTGRILLRPDKDEPDKWVKIVFEITRNNKTMYLKFCDMRQFGKVRVLSKDELELLQNKYGIDVLNQDISAEEFLKLLKSKKSTIKNVLLDQKIISGLGNIYATETLFLSKINPKTPTQDLTLKQSEEILKNSREILKEGIKNRGSTLSDKMYVDIFGKSGSQQNHFKIYGKNICPVCNSKTMFEKINGRGTYYCPTCQPIKTSSEKNKKI